MLVDRVQLAEALRRVVAVVDPDNGVGILQYVCFVDGTIQGSSGITGVVTKAPNLEKPFCIAGEWLLQLLNKLDDAQVDLSVADSSLVVKAGRHKSKTPIVDPRRFPNLLATVVNTSPVKCVSGLANAIGEVLSLTSEAKQANLRGIGLWKNYVYGSDGDRATRCNWDGEIVNPLVLPRESASLFAKCGDPKTFRTGPNSGNVFATYDGFLVISRLLDPKLPFVAIDQMLPQTSSVVELPEGILASIDRVRIMGGEGGIGLECLAGRLRVYRGKPGCLSEEAFEAVSLPDFSCSVRPEYLVAALKRTRKCDLTDVLVGKRRSIQFTAQDGAVLQHLLGLVT